MIEYNKIHFMVKKLKYILAVVYFSIAGDKYKIFSRLFSSSTFYEVLFYLFFITAVV